VRKRACARARDAPRSRARRMVKRMEDRWAHVSEHEESDSPLGEELGRPPKPCGPHRLFPKNSLNHCSNTTVTRVVLHASASPSASLLSCTSDTVANRPFLGVPAGTPRLARGRRCAPARCRRGRARAAGLDGRRAGVEAEDARLGINPRVIQYFLPFFGFCLNICSFLSFKIGSLT
jgi:hypothetical protein